MKTQNTQNQEVELSEYWKSLDEKYRTPEFMKTFENEFASSPLKSEDGKDGLARRQFMKLMGASVAFSAAACVRRPVQTIIPYNKRPGEIIPDVPNFYASSWFDGNETLGLIIRTREGRPLFVGGNPEHPLNGQGIGARASAHILALYDPDRLKSPIVNSIQPKKRKNSVTVSAKWESVDPKIAAQLAKGGVAILTSSYPSPHTQALMNSFLGKFGGKKYVWDTISLAGLRKAQQLSYGSAIVPNYRVDKASLIVSLDADFLGTYISPVRYTKDFTAGRSPDGKMNRLISFQSVPSITSLNSDDNYPVRASQQVGVAMGLLANVLAAQGKAVPAKVSDVALTDTELGLAEGTLSSVAKILVANAGSSIVMAGGMQADTADDGNVALHLAANWLNSALGNEGKTITAQGGYIGLEGDVADWDQLQKDIEGDKVKTLIMHNVNPGYTLPATVDLQEILNKVEVVISTSNWLDESARLADYIAPCGHPMENWNEFEAVSGVFSIQQPTIRPLYETRSFEDSLMAWSKAANKPIASEATFYEYMKANITKKVGGDEGWFKYLQAGFRGTLPSGGGARNFNAGSTGAIKKPAAASGLEAVIFPTVHMLDGSLANVSWLQELPCPVTKVSWGNYISVSPKKAKELGLRDGMVVELSQGDKKLIKAPVFVNPGQQTDTLGIPVGYGRTHGGELMKNVGVNAFKAFSLSGVAVELTKTGEKDELAVTQGHNSMEGRQIVVETSLEKFKHGETGIHRHKVFSIWGQHKYEGHKWGMVIDLNTCTGCSACVIACQSENNIPVVGKKYVMQGREMHWLRIDRYYKGSEDNPDAVFQPVACQQCENAPCETVCPVVATVHSDEGLNDMVYNRCVGTRYCSNNCPYKVRRFNWFYYDSHHAKTPLHMALNPEVTVRTRGVMEKCTFCVQRIKEAKNTAKDENRPLADGEVKSACSEVCPTGGVVFGDLNDKNSAVSKLFESQRQYTLLEEVNAAPRVRYLSKIRNTDRDLGGGHHGPADHGTPEKGHGEPAHKEEHI